MTRRAGCVCAWLIVALAACGPSPSRTASPAQGDGSPPAYRIVTLSPHLAELVFAVGGGGRLVGVSAFTDYPEAAALLPVIGDAFNVDLEQLLLLEPDLLLAWESGTPDHVIDHLRQRGFRVEVVQTRSLEDIALAIERIGSLTGNEPESARIARAFRRELGDIAAAAEPESDIAVFYQVDARPLYTISGAHFISELIDLCGGRNIFADIGDLAPRVSVEAVLTRNPEVLLASSDAGPEALSEWARWPDLAANRYGNLFELPANEVGRPTPRLVAGARSVCDTLSTARRNRERVKHD